MSALALESAQATARAMALHGDAAGFESQMQAVLSLDREGRVDMRSMRMLRVVACARLADMVRVEEALAALDPLSPAEWREILTWLRQAPDMEHARYVGFVRTLDRRMQRHAGVSRLRRFTPMLVVMLVASVASLLVLLWRMAPRDAARDAETTMQAVLGADAESLFRTVPAAWVTTLTQAARTAAAVSPPSPPAAPAALQALSQALVQAAAAPSAAALSRALLGDLARPQDLVRLADAVNTWRDCPWLEVSRWSDRTMWSWRPPAGGELAWRCLLRHAPLAAWMPGWFNAGWRVDPLDPVEPRARRSASDAGEVSLTLQMGSDAWPLVMARNGRWWMPVQSVRRWETVAPRLAAEHFTPDRVASMQTDILEGLQAMTQWIREHSDGRGSAQPDAKALPWWVP